MDISKALQDLESEELECGCHTRRDYDGEQIRTHCPDHCPNVQSGKWERCGGC